LVLPESCDITHGIERLRFGAGVVDVAAEDKLHDGLLPCVYGGLAVDGIADGVVLEAGEVGGNHSSGGQKAYIFIQTIIPHAHHLGAGCPAPVGAVLYEGLGARGVVSA
jgi:hypothetical protein